MDAPKQWVGMGCIEEVLTGVYSIMLHNGDRKRPRVRPLSPAHLVDVLVTAVSWLSIVIVGGGVSSLLGEERSV